MKISTISFIACALCAASTSSAYGEEPDSLKTQELQEVVVEGDAQITSASKSTYLPTTKIKEAASDAVDLLRRMAIPELSINPTGSGLKTVTGRDVKIFINYVQASDEDIVGLKTTDVKRVEYLDYPTDPRFRNVPHAVNIIVQEYEWGGYTKLSDRQWMLQGISNQGSVFSKFAYKKMVFDLYGSWEYIKNSDIGTSTYSTYKLADKVVERNRLWLDSKRRALYFPATFRASYNTDKMQIINTVGFTFHDMFKCMEHSALTFSDAPGRNYEITTNTPRVGRAIIWNGNYFFMLPHNWTVGVYPNINYGNNGSWSNYSTTIPESTPIVNNAKEDTYYGRVDLNLNKKLGNHHTFSLSLNGSLSKYDVDYFGSTQYNTVFNHHFWGIGPKYNLNLDRVSISTDVGAAFEYQKTNGTTYKDTYPYFHFNGSWAPNTHHRLGLWMQYATNSPGESMRTPNVLQENELMYATGNPNLKNARHVTVSMSYTFLPSNIFSMSAYTQYFGMYDRAVRVYEPYKDGSALLGTYHNSGDFTEASVGLNATLRLLNNSLLIQASPSYNHYNSTGYLHSHHNSVNFYLYAQYYLGNFNFTGYYGTRSSGLDSTSGTYTTNRGTYNISAGWSNKDWNVSLIAVNFLRHNASTYWSELNSPLYSYHLNFYNGNASAAIGVTVTYTIGYGKPIQRGNEIRGLSGAGSAIMN